MKIGYLGHASLHGLRAQLKSRDLPALCYQGASRGFPFPAGEIIIAEYLARGLSVVVLVYERSDAPDDVIRVGNLTFVCISTRSHTALYLTDFGAARRARDLLRAEECEVLHVQWTYEYLYLARATSIPYLVTARDVPLYVLGTQNTLSGIEWALLRCLFCEHVIGDLPAVSVCSPYMVQELKRGYGITAALCPNPVPLLAREEPTSRTSSMPEGSSVVVLSVSNAVDKRKNIEVLFAACELCVEAGLDVELRLAGRFFNQNGDYAAAITRRWPQLRVKWLGHLSYEDLQEAYRQCNVFVHPALEESFGMTVIEALVHRKPVVVGRESGALPWLLSISGDAGILVDVTQPRAIADAVLRIKNNYQEYLERAQGAPGRLRHMLEPSRVVSYYVELLSAVKQQATSTHLV